MMHTLTDEQGLVLVKLARATIAAELGVHTDWPGGDDALHHRGATFVTLEIDGALRGCIGTLSAFRSIRDDVTENALAAAFNDPRFPPLSASELERVSVSVSLLTAPVALEFDGTEAGAIDALRPGVDGLILRSGRHRATYLPQVWRQLPDPKQFLHGLKRKARLDERFWSPNIELLRYEVREWSE